MLQVPRLRASLLAFSFGLGSVGVACGDDGGTSTSGSSESGPGSGGSTGDGGGTPTSSSSSGSSGAGVTTTSGASTATGTGGDDPATTGSSTTSGQGGAGGSGTGGAGGDGSGAAGGATGSGGQGGAEPECTVPENCPDPGNFCIARTCDGGVCGETFVDLGTPLPNVNQTQGDCSTVVCDGAGDSTEQDDDLDFIEDADPCTIESCSAGEPVSDPADLGLECGVGLQCDGNGNCVGCITADDCPGTDDECRTRVCDIDGQCAPTFADAGTALTDQTAGDCQELQCDGAGNIVSVDADGDPPPSIEDCVAKICDEGAPADQPVGSGASCDEDGGVLCDGNGACVECLTVAQCPADTACTTYSCLLGACVPDYELAGTVVADPVDGDCRSDQCDGAGNVVADADFDSDLPVDGLQCTNDVCASGDASNPPVTINTACNQNGGVRCNGNGACVECTAPAQCPSNVCTSGQCVDAACNDDVQNGDETGLDCGGMDCANCPNGQGCDLDDDCLSGFCNPNTLLCAAPVCNDGFFNGSETDVDCGGPTCPDCDLGMACNGNSDCLSNYCFDGFCSTFYCGDGDVNPGEQCDDGDEIDFNGCDNNCVWTCGNSLLNTGEACEDGDHDSNDGCSSTCGIEANYQCTLAAPGVCTRQEVRCNNSTNDDGDGFADASDPDCAWYNAGQIPACAAGQTLYIFNSVRVPQAIPDVATVTNDITVPNIGTIRRVMLRINVTHTFDADLDISLTSPAGTVRDVTSDNGSSGDNYQNTRFRQGAATSITGGSAPFNNEYRPEGNFDGFNGASATGTWRLTVTDDLGGDTGTLSAYELAICAN